MKGFLTFVVALLIAAACGGAAYAGALLGFTAWLGSGSAMRPVTVFCGFVAGVVVGGFVLSRAVAWLSRPSRPPRDRRWRASSGYGVASGYVDTSVGVVELGIDVVDIVADVADDL